MAAKPSFHDALKTKRCIIPATSFCEHTGPKGRMTRHFISHARTPLFRAGLWGRHSWEGGVTESYSMVMMESLEGDDMARFHNRQPVVLDRASARIWLDLSADHRPILQAQPPASLVFDPPEPALA